MRAVVVGAGFAGLAAADALRRSGCASSSSISTWGDDPWARGAYSTLAVGTRGADLVAPVGPIAFCGEQTAGEQAALMEGALRSGLRAARDVLGRRQDS